MLSSIAQDFNIPTNALYSLRDQFIQEKKSFIDLVSGNVNAQGIHFPAAILYKALAQGVTKSRTYQPDPLGQKAAREAIGRYYKREGLDLTRDQIVLTPGTSISYWYAFKVLADSGDEVLCPTPSYPLFDSIAALSGIKCVPYSLKEGARWTIDFAQLESRITSRTKAVVLISPHNPTGAVATAEEIQTMAEIAGRHHLAIIADEVFSPFLFVPGHLPRPAETSAPLVITLNGLSKMLALPGVKIGWMAVTGSSALVSKTMKALEMISDTFLPVSEVAQFSLPTILNSSRPFQKKYVSQVKERMEAIVELLTKVPEVEFCRPEGGFFLTLRWKKEGIADEDVALSLLKNDQLLVHPGYFYDMEPRHLVLSLVNPPARIKQAADAIQHILR